MIEDIQKAIDYIEQNLFLDINLDNISENNNISKFYLSRLFNEIVGYSITTYIEKRRLSEAALLLVNTNKSITEIAYYTGFNSPKYFASCFRKIFNVTPSVYKKRKYFIILQKKIQLKGDKAMKYDKPETLVDEIFKNCTSEDTLRSFIAKVENCVLTNLEKSTATIYTIINNAFYEIIITVVSRTVEIEKVYALPKGEDGRLDDLELIESKNQSEQVELKFNLHRKSGTMEVNTYNSYKMPIAVYCPVDNYDSDFRKGEMELFQPEKDNLWNDLTYTLKQLSQSINQDDLDGKIEKLNKYKFYNILNFAGEYGYIVLYEKTDHIVPFLIYLNLTEKQGQYRMLRYIPKRSRKFSASVTGDTFTLLIGENGQLSYRLSSEKGPKRFVRFENDMSGYGTFSPDLK